MATGIALSAVETLLLKARNASQEDVDRLCHNISELLTLPDKSAECSALLRQLFLLLQSSDVEPCIPRTLLTEMLKVLGKPETEKHYGKQCALCSLILKELTAGDQLLSETRVTNNRPPQQALLSIYSLQGVKENCIQDILPSAVRWLCAKDLDSQLKALTFLVAVSTLHGVLKQENISDTSEQLCGWLMNASLYQARNPYTLNPFRKDEETQVTEIDGSPCRNFFTVLSVGQCYTDDQYVNIYSFSLLYKWLLHCSTQSSAASQPRDIANSYAEKHHNPSLRGSLAASSSSSMHRDRLLAEASAKTSSQDVQGVSPELLIRGRATRLQSLAGGEASPLIKKASGGSGEGIPFTRAGGVTRTTVVSRVLQSLVSRSVDYCFRLMDQCERKAKMPSDAELQTACLVEVVVIFDLICKLDSGQIPRVHQELRRLLNRVSGDLSQSALVLKIVQFFLNHSATVVHDPQEVYNLFFGIIISQQFHDPGLAFDTIAFICDNICTLCYNTNILTKFFPSILKILAWHPRTFLTEFTIILPAMMGPLTSLEILHTLLDLPCLTAALEVREKMKKMDQALIPGSQTSVVEPASSSEAYQTLRFKPLFNFITRAEGGQGDTINRLSMLHSVLKDMRTGARVHNTSQCVPVLLRRWFNTIITEAEEDFVVQILPAMLERSGLLFDIADYRHDVVVILAEQLLKLVEHYPRVLVEHSADVIEFVHNTGNLQGRQDFYGNLVYCIGEYCSGERSPGFTPELIAQYFDVFEVVTYELCGMTLADDEEVSIHPKMFTLLMAAMAKLSTRRQDLIPRTLLCLTKVAKQHYTLTQDPLAQEAIMTCAQEHVNLLQEPNFAASILNPGEDIRSGSWHMDGYSLPLLVRTIHRMTNWK